MASSVMKKQYVTDTITESGIEVPAGSSASAEFSVAKSGYTPIGIIGIRKSGTANGSMCIGAFYRSLTNTDNMIVALVNPTTSTRTINVIVSVLYERS